MNVFSQLQEFLSHLPAFQTQAERMALISQAGFENLYNNIDWNGSAKAFTSAFLNLLIGEGQETLLLFLTRLHADTTLLGRDQQERLLTFSQAIQALTPEQWKISLPSGVGGVLHEALPLSSDLVLIDASLDPFESPYEEKIKNGIREIHYKNLE